MGLFDALVLRADGGFAGYPPDHDYWYTMRGEGSASGMLVTEETARKLSAWYRGRDLLSTALAMLPLQVFRRLPNEQGAEPARDNPLYDILHDKPNAWQDSYQWRRQSMYHLIDFGNAYSRIVSGRRGFVDELWPIHPKMVTVKQVSTGRLVYQVKNANGEPTTYGQDEILHLRGASDDGLVGMGVLRYARERLGLGLAIGSYSANIFGTGTLNGGIIENPGVLNKEAARRMAESFVTTPGEWGMPKVLEQGSKWAPNKISPEDFQMIESEKHSVDDIARWLGVPRHMLENSDPSFGNAEQFNQNFETFSIGPWLSLFEFALNDQLVLAKRQYYVEFNRDAFRRADFAQRWAGYQIAVSTGTFTRNEVRRLENRNALPGLDQPIDPAHLSGKQPPDGEDELPPAKGKDAPKPVKEDDEKAQAIVLESAARVLRKEVRAVQRMAVQHAQRQDAFAVAVTDFYAAHATLLMESLKMPKAEAEAYCAGQAAQAIDFGMSATEHWTQPDYAIGLAAWALESEAA
jgi:HK97 family phage portal protein